MTVTKPARQRITIRERVAEMLEGGTEGTVHELAAQCGVQEGTMRQSLLSLESEGLSARVGTRLVDVRQNSRVVHQAEAVLWGAGDGRPPAELRHKLADAEVQAAIRAAAVWPKFLVGKCGASQCTQHASA
jgi:DeoR/GlpR family transcriptional regulator of sugar metabolism